MWSGWPDLNRRPLDPQSSALTKLRHSPWSIEEYTDGPLPLRPSFLGRSRLLADHDLQRRALEPEPLAQPALQRARRARRDGSVGEEHEAGRPHARLGDVLDARRPALDRVAQRHALDRLAQ